MRASLQPGESVITPEGIWLGNNWLRVSKDQDATAGGITRQAELESLLHEKPEEAAVLEYVRTHTGFCRRIVVTDGDLQRVS